MKKIISTLVVTLSLLQPVALYYYWLVEYFSYIRENVE